jgi:hypothetical protein
MHSTNEVLPEVKQMLSEKMFKQPKGLAACEEQAASPLARTRCFLLEKN